MFRFFFFPITFAGEEGRHAVLPPAPGPDRRGQVRPGRRGVQPQALRGKPRSQEGCERRTCCTDSFAVVGVVAVVLALVFCAAVV